MVWIFMDWLIKGKPTLMGACAGIIAGLVVITPGAGFMQPQMAMVAGILGGIWCFTAVEMVKRRTNLDDACDSFGVHGMGGFLGTCLVGLLSDPETCLVCKPGDSCSVTSSVWYPTTMQRDFCYIFSR